ncbi:hypothetical protein ACHQM5_019916 [Ranunculus cassubicifolius]
MSDGKQSHLNGAYYGPSIPPQRSYHSGGHGRSLCCFPCRLLSFLCKLIATIIVLIGIAILVLWIIYRPTNLKFHVVNASLTEFNLTNDSNQLQHNLKLDISVRNPNKKIGVYYDLLEARAYYEGEEFDRVTLERFYQGHKNTSMIHPVFQGNGTVRLGGSEIQEFDKEKKKGEFNIDIRIYLRIRFKIGDFKTRRMKPKVKCDIRVPLTAGAAGGFSTKKCKIDY